MHKAGAKGEGVRGGRGVGAVALLQAADPVREAESTQRRTLWYFALQPAKPTLSARPLSVIACSVHAVHVVSVSARVHARA